MQPSADCPHCPRLVAFRQDNQKKYNNFFNGAVPAFGPLDAELLVVGLAPGLKGANATGRPFTGDYAGDVLYASLLHSGFARGSYGKHAGDGLELLNARITNAVRCVPPENKPETSEIKQCNDFLRQEMQAMPNLRVLISLGGIAHKAVLMAAGEKQSAFRFAHGAVHKLVLGDKTLVLLNSYHCSRYNINTGRMSQLMLDEVFEHAKTVLSTSDAFPREQRA